MTELFNNLIPNLRQTLQHNLKKGKDGVFTLFLSLFFVNTFQLNITAAFALLIGHQKAIKVIAHILHFILDNDYHLHIIVAIYMPINISIIGGADEYTNH